MKILITNNDIREFLGLPKTDKIFEVSQVDSLGVNFNTLMFINKPNIDLSILDDSSQCIYLVDNSCEEFSSFDNDFIRVRNPKFLFCKVVEHFSLPSELQVSAMRWRYRDYSEYSGSIYCKEVLIGENCQIDPGVIIGGTDFSPVIGDSRSELVQFPQLGGVSIGDNVVIKYNSMIGKGTFGFTIIGSNTMIDYGCQIGHNCRVGDSCIIAAGTIIGGSTTIGDNTTIGIGAKIRNGIKIGKNASIGMGAVVVKDVPPGCTVVGNPAKIIKHDHIFSEKGLV